MLKNNCSAIDVFRRVCRRILCLSFGESAGEAILFFLQDNLGRDPFEVLWDDPKAFYQALEKIFGAGAKVLINVLVTTINRECGLNFDPEDFLNLIRGGDQRSVEKIRYFMSMVAELMGGRARDDERC